MLEKKNKKFDNNFYSKKNNKKSNNNFYLKKNNNRFNNNKKKNINQYSKNNKFDNNLYIKMKNYAKFKKENQKSKMTNYLYINSKIKKGVFLKKPSYNEVLYPFHLNLKLINEYLKKK
jgi:hypothetical protein